MEEIRRCKAQLARCCKTSRCWSNLGHRAENESKLMGSFHEERFMRLTPNKQRQKAPRSKTRGDSGMGTGFFFFFAHVSLHLWLAYQGDFLPLNACCAWIGCTHKDVQERGDKCDRRLANSATLSSLQVSPLCLYLSHRAKKLVNRLYMFFLEAITFTDYISGWHFF